MNKTVTINLSGQVFQIDEDAYEKLKGYLDSIHARFAGTEGAEEIMADIEARLAEMFLANLGDKKNVISISHVDNVMQVMGKPEDFGDVDDSEEKQKSRTWSATINIGTKTGKKLYRDEDNKILGGVISGLCAYLGINDPVWVRLAVAILFLVSGGTVFILYVILWVIVPKAVTASEKLEMKGEPINIDNIERTIREDIEDLKGRIHNMDKHSASEKVRGIFLTITGLFFRIFGLIFHFLRRVVGIIIIVGGVWLLITLAWGWPFYGEDYSQTISFLPYYFDNQTEATIAIIGFCLLVIVPFIALIMLGFRLLFFRSFRGRGLGISFGGLWILGWILAPIALAGIHKDFSSGNSITQQVPISKPANGLLHVKILEDRNTGESFFNLPAVGRIRMEGDSFYAKGNTQRETIEFIQLKIEKSATGNLYLEKKIYASGRNGNEGLERASHVNYKIQQQDSTLYLAKYLSFPKKDKIRHQQVLLTLYVPEGDSVALDENTSVILSGNSNTNNYYDYIMAGHTWAMKPEGLSCATCKQFEKDKVNYYGAVGNTREYAPGSFTEITVNGIANVNIHQGDHAKVEITGPEEVTKDIEMKTTDNLLSIKVDRHWFEYIHHRRSDMVIIDITVPKLDDITVNGATNLSIKHFKANELSVEVTGASHADLDVTADTLTVNASGASDINLSGSGNELNSDVSGASNLNAFSFEAHKGAVNASGASHSHVKVTEELNASASGASDVEYDGSPVISSDASGFSSIKPKR